MVRNKRKLDAVISWILIFCINEGIVQAQDNVTFESPTNYFVTKGDSITLKCVLDSDMSFLFDKQLLIAHKSFKTGLTSTVSRQGSLVHPYDERDSYHLEFIASRPIGATLHISGVTDEMDGQFFCRVKVNGVDTIQESATTNLTVASGVETLVMTVGGTTITEGMILEIREGTIPVVCTATGSNPEPVIHLMLEDEELDVQNMSVGLENSSILGRRSYFGSITYLLDFMYTMYGKRLTCHAKTDLPTDVDLKLEDKSITTIFGEREVSDKQNIYCMNNTADVNAQQVTLKCLLSKEFMTESISFHLRTHMDRPDRVVRCPGNLAPFLIQCDELDLNSTFKEVVLTFSKIKDWHFSANISLNVVGLDNIVHKQSLYLFKFAVAVADGVDVFRISVICCAAVLFLAVITTVLVWRCKTKKKQSERERTDEAVVVDLVVLEKEKEGEP